MPFTTFDVWDQALLTDIITRPQAGQAPGAAEDTGSFLGQQIAPEKSIAARNAKIRVQDLKPFGLGPYRAPDSTPALYKPAVSWKDEVMELLILDEMERITEEDWMKLQSADENIARSAGADLVTRGRILRLRNQRRREAMRWAAFSGFLTVTYPTGSQLQVDYGLPAGHKPVLATPWSDTTNADPVTDIQNWSEQIAADSGFYGNRVHMNSKTYNYLLHSVKIQAGINVYAPSANTIYRPRREDLLNLFTSFATDVQIVIYDNGYRAEGADLQGVGSITKYLPDGYVLMTTDYTIDGVNIADTLDGQVTVQTGWNTTEIRQGEQAQVLLEGIANTHFLRYSSSSVPRLNIPEAFLWAKVA